MDAALPSAVAAHTAWYAVPPLMLVPALVAVAGGVLAAVWRPSHQARSLIQHFAAGVILAALAVELLPEIAREHAHVPVVLGAFAAGCLFMFALKLVTARLEGEGESEGEGEGAHRASATDGAAVLQGAAATAAALPVGLLAATFLDVAMDGFIIGAGFAAAAETGRVLALGLSIELLFLGLALVSERTGGPRIVLLTVLLGVTVLAFSMLGRSLLSGASHDVIAGTLSFSAAALLYLVTEELLMEAHTVAEHTGSTLVLFAGFFCFWAIQLLA